MSERREHKRVSTRMKVEFGEDGFDQTGFATDVSVGGMYMECRHPAPRGTRLHLHVFEKDTDFYVEAVVVRQVVVNPQLRQVTKSAVGLRFLTPDELVSKSVPSSQRARVVHALQCPDASSVRKLLDEQIARRLIVVPTSEPPPSASELVEFTIEIGFGGHDDVEGVGRVVQLLGGDGAAQAVLEVRDTDAVREALEATLE